MIIIKISKKFKRINQEIYNKFVNYKILHLTVSLIGFDYFTIHGHYIRKIIGLSGNYKNFIVTRIRVVNGTHTVSLSSMVPYQHCTYDDIISISIEDIIPADCPIVTEMIRSFIMHKFSFVKKDYNSICSIINTYFVELSTWVIGKITFFCVMRIFLKLTISCLTSL